MTQEFFYEIQDGFLQDEIVQFLITNTDKTEKRIFIFDEPFTFKLVIGSVLIFFAILYSERLILNKPRIAKTD